MRLNGWQRLWVAGTVPWAFAVLATVAYLFSGPGIIWDDGLVKGWLMISAVVWAVTSAAMFGVGWAVGWIRRGFDEP